MAALRRFCIRPTANLRRVWYTRRCGCDARPAGSAGEEYFQYKLKPQLKARGVERVQELCARGGVVLVSQGLEHVMKPLAQHLGVKRLVANRLEFRDGVATGRLLER